jgi:hypothetical protein
VPPRDLRADCPPWLQEVILKCLEVDAAKRWQTGAQLALALQTRPRCRSPRAEQACSAAAAETFKRWFKAMGAEPEKRPVRRWPAA